jgi:tetratricopeptide (TPR) repeat protein
MSFPPPSSPQQPPPNSPFPQFGPAPAPRRNLRRLIWLALVAALVGWGLTQAPREYGRWRLAAAVKLRGENKKEEAYQALSDAMARFPDNPKLLLTRAQWRLEDGQEKEALEDCDKAIELAKDDPIALQMRGTMLLNAGHFERAIDDLKKVERDSRRSGYPPRDLILNELAYAQALGKIELDEALNRVNRAIEIESDPKTAAEYSRADIAGKLANTLDTRGFILHRLGRNEQALGDMDESLTRLEEARHLTGKETDVLDEVRKAGREKLPKELADYARNTAVIHYHRSLVLSALGRDDEAKKDWELARELAGKEPDETLF